VLHGTNEIIVIDPVTYAMEWPLRSFGLTSPYDFYDQAWYTACPCFDRLAAPYCHYSSALNGDLASPYNMRVLCYDLDTGNYYHLPIGEPIVDPANPLYLDFRGLRSR
jgi:hypothetical protein